MSVDTGADSSDGIATGEMAALVGAKDWAATSLGPREAWSPSLKLIAATVLASRFPMAVRWGPDLVLVYNDGYRPILGEKHPRYAQTLNNLALLYQDMGAYAQAEPLLQNALAITRQALGE